MADFLQAARGLLEEEPDTDYGYLLPVKRNRATGAYGAALPGFLRSQGQGYLDLLEGPRTGAMTPEATAALLPTIPVPFGPGGGAGMMAAAGAAGRRGAVAGGAAAALTRGGLETSVKDAGAVAKVARRRPKWMDENMAGLLGWGQEVAGPSASGTAKAGVSARTAQLAASGKPLSMGQDAWAVRRAAEARMDPNNAAPDFLKQARMTTPGMLDVEPGSILGYNPEDLGHMPPVPQFGLERAPAPPKGPPAGVQAVADPANWERMHADIARGRDELGGGSWYNAEPLREAFMQELGAREGDRAFRDYMGAVAATSPRTKVPQNLKNASLLYGWKQQGLPVGTKPPGVEGYPMMGVHMKNVNQAWSPEGFNSVKNPKIAAFFQNLTGNWYPRTIDAHDLTFMNVRNSAGKVPSAPNPKWYGYLEDLMRQHAEEAGMPMASHQASGWLTAAGLRSPAEPLMATMERKIGFTALARGEHPDETLRAFIRGERPLLARAGGAGPTPAGLLTQPGGTGSWEEYRKGGRT